MPSKTRPATAVKTAMPVTLAALALAASTTSSAHAQDAVQWRVEDGGNGHWYQLIISGPITWTDAREACSLKGGYLTSSRSSAEESLLLEIANRAEHPDAWVDDFGGNAGGPWLGGYQPIDALPAQPWAWVSGEEWDWVGWAAGEPNGGFLPGNSITVMLGWAGTNTYRGWADSGLSDYPPYPLPVSYVIEWSADCNGDGIVDYGQILDGTITDCDGNGIPDDCELTETLALSETRTPSDITDFIEFDVSSMSGARDTVVVELSASGDLATTGEFMLVYLDDASLGLAFVADGAACDTVSTTFEIPAADWNAAGLDGTRLIRISGNAIDPTACPDPFTAIDVTVPIVFEDCNANGSWDACDIADGSEPDADGDGLMDSCDGCPYDSNKSEPGACGCGVPETGDTDGDGILDCIDPCPTWPYDCSEDGQTIIVAVGQSIQEAIAVVPPGGVVELETGTHTGSGAAVVEIVGKPFTLRGAAGGDPVVIDGEHLRRGLYCSDPLCNGTTIVNIEFLNGDSGYAGGGAYLRNVEMTFDNCLFAGNRASGSGTEGNGGGMYSLSSEVSLADCEFLNNLAMNAGGGLCIEGGQLLANNCQSELNEAMNFGGGAAIDSATAELASCSFGYNSSANYAGGLSTSNVDLAMTGCQITENSSYSAAGARFFITNGLVSDTDFTMNLAEWNGGGGISQGQSLLFLDCRFTANVAAGAAGFGTVGFAQFDACMFEDNVALLTEGGGLQCYESEVTIAECTFRENSANVGGAIALTTQGGAPCTVTIVSSEIQSNDGTSQGDAIHIPVGTAANIGSTLICGNGDSVVDLAAGHDHSIAVTSRGFVACWGSNLFGQSSPPPDLYGPGNTVIDVKAGNWHSVAVREDGSIRCWGANDYGQSSPPDDLQNGTLTVIQIAAGSQHNLAILADGSIAAWGRNDSGQCNIPKPALDSSNAVTAIAAGNDCSLAVLANGDLVGWGDNTFGQIDVPSGIGSSGLRAVEVAASFHTVVLLEDGTVRCWGRNSGGQCNVPQDIGMPGSRVVDVAVSAFQTFALLEDGSLRCWGAATSPQGLSQPCPLPPEFELPAVSHELPDIGAYHALAIIDDELIAWGWNGDGQTDVPAGLSGPNQVAGPYTDLGGNCITEVCDSDNDGTLDCNDGCPDDPDKINPGQCGCGIEDVDTDGDGIADCVDPCPNWPYDCSSDGQTIFVAVGQSIQSAIDVTPAGGIVQLGAGSFAQSSIDPTGKAITIQGTVDVDGGLLTTIDAGSAGSVLVFQSGEGRDTQVLDLILTGGQSEFGGGVECSNASSPTIAGCRIDGNAAGAYGGGINCYAGSNPLIESCSILGNSAATGGGGIAIDTSAPMIMRCVVEGNSAPSGAGIYAVESIDTELGESTVCGNDAEQIFGVINDLGDNCILDECGDDLDGNGIPDGCDPDCNGDGLPDGYEIETGTQLDCDGDGLPDDCAIVDGVVADCNGNGIPDSCDIADGAEEDDNLNDVPDSCDIAAGDLNVDGCIDSGDLGLLIALWGLSNPPLGDLNGDGSIGPADLGLLIGNWTPCEP